LGLIYLWFFMSRVEKERLCPECKSPKLITDYEKQEEICEGCGYTTAASGYVSTFPEWRAFDDEQSEKRTRTGPPSTYTMHDKGLSTTIPYDAKLFRKYTLQERHDMQKLMLWQKRTRTSNSDDRNLSQALSDQRRLSDQLNLPENVEERGGLIYREALQKKLVRGRSIPSMAAVALYAACRESENAKRPLSDFKDASGLDKKELGRNYRLLLKELGLNMKPDSARSYVSRFRTKIENLTIKDEMIAIKILKEAQKVNTLTQGKSGKGLAAAALYIASVLNHGKDGTTQRELAEVSNITEVTVRNRYKNLIENLMIEVLL